MPFSRSDPCSTADTCIAAVGLGVIRHAADPKTQPTVTESWQPTHPLLCLQMASVWIPTLDDVRTRSLSLLCYGQLVEVKPHQVGGNKLVQGDVDAATITVGL